MSLKAFQQKLSRNLAWYVAAALGLGLLLGDLAGSFLDTYGSSLSGATTVVVFFMIYPMMVNLQVEALGKAMRNWRALLLSLVYNFLWAPFLGFLLSKLFLPEPLLAFGFMLVMVVPCSSMSIGYTGLVKGNLELATVVVAASFLAAIPAIPFWASIFGGQYQVSVPIDNLLWTVVTVLILPMILGYLTRTVLIRWMGKSRFQQIMPIFPIVTQLSMFLIVFLIFFLKATLLLSKWTMLLWLIVPNVFFMAITLVLITWLDRRLGLTYEDHMGVVFASSGKNNGTAIALATAAFSPLVAVPAATLPIFQILFMVVYLKLEPRVRTLFRHHESTEPLPASNQPQPITR
jgi:ACR3 family arsenite transporter